MGTACRVYIHPDVWILACWNVVTQHMKRGARIVIGDARMRREAEFLESKGALGIRLERPRKDRLSSIEGRDEKHATETELDYHEFDRVIVNNSTLRVLFNTIDSYLE